ncbi:LacI family DNA-binding transcriptional regulator [Alteromonas sp. a30]|uniref:LacI family DNA-binding transcriptional regulator n=1 Tax=Alteromonas sp. a30 TaxID=2730917 RepID=UPI0022814ABF|nr:LacI family DNA-binding transcriptional regulator [Alteromonas sp. a30]MCY7294789.1 LacI family DNA-binding transcriptional regulator [Alteromonas sp. a30]
MTTIYKVAERAGVSLSTVSRVLNGRKTVNEALRLKVEQAMKELDYRPNSLARSLASNRSDSIGVVVSELSTPFFGEMLQSIETTLRECNKHVIITVGHNDLAQEKEAVEFLISRNCDALILQVGALDDAYIQELNQNRLPVSLVNRCVEGLEEACFTLDNETGGYLCTKHLLEQGHTEIAYISGPSDKTDAMQRFKGHKRALEEAGITFSEALYYEGSYQEEDGEAGLIHLLESNKHFTALVCGNDWMASGAIRCARARGIQVPQALSVVGFDNIVVARHVFPTLTTINHPIADMGKMAAKYVINKVYSGENMIQNLFAPSLVIRDSCSSQR